MPENGFLLQCGHSSESDGISSSQKMHDNRLTAMKLLCHRNKRMYLQDK